MLQVCSSIRTAMPGATGPMSRRCLTPETRPAVEQLLFEMDRCGVD